MADKKISDFTAATTLADADLLEIETSGGNSRKMEASDAKAYMAGWTLASSTTVSSPVTNVDVTGLAGASDIRIVCRNLTQSVSGVLTLQVSVNNGSSFYTTSGDYVLTPTNGAEANNNYFGTFHGTNATAARSGEIVILGAGVTGGPKTADCVTAGAGNNRFFVASTSPINAVRINSSGGGNIGGSGTIDVFTR